MALGTAHCSKLHKRLDRFGRSLRHLINALAELEARGIAFVSLRDNLDLGTPLGRLMFQIISAMAEFERALIQERVKGGLRHAQSKGKRLGRPTIVVDRSRIASLRAQGRGWKKIAAELGVGVGAVLRAASRADYWVRPPSSTLRRGRSSAHVRPADEQGKSVNAPGWNYKLTSGLISSQARRCTVA